MKRKRRAVSKRRRSRRNPLTRKEVAALRQLVRRRFRNYGRFSPVEAAFGAGMLNAAGVYSKSSADSIKSFRSSTTMAKSARRQYRQAIDSAYASRRNPLLQVVLPNRRRRRRNPPSYIKGYPNRGGAKVRGGQRISRVAFVDQKEAATYPGFAKALALHRSFHGRAPTHFTRVRVEDGSPAVTKRAVVLIGEAPAIEYRTWRYQNSAKSHTKTGQRIVWRHKLGEQGGKPAYWVHDPVSGITSLLGGTYRVAGKPAFYHH